LPQDNATNSI